MPSEHTCTICHKQITEDDRAQYEAEGGEGYPDCHYDCAVDEDVWTAYLREKGRTES